MDEDWDTKRERLHRAQQRRELLKERAFKAIFLGTLAALIAAIVLTAVKMHDPKQPTIGCTSTRVEGVGSVKLDIEDGRVICRCE